MNRFGITLCALLAFGSAVAQTMDRFDAHVGDLRLLMSKKIQADMGVSKAQVDTFNAFAQNYQKQATAFQQQWVKSGKDPRTLTPSDPTLIGYVEQLKNNIFLKLSAKQLRRLRELTLQNEGLSSILDPVVAKRLNMTEAQSAKAKGIFEASTKKENDIREANYKKAIAPYQNVRPRDQKEADAINEKIGKAEEAGLKPRIPELKAIVEKAKKDLKAVLTAKQYADFMSLTGKKFTG